MGGHPSTEFWHGRVSVADAEGGPAALLATDDGTWLHHSALEAPRFIEGGAIGTWAPDALRAAIAVRTATSAFDVQRWTIVILEADGRSQNVARHARSSFWAPEMWWNNAGTHLLVRWPDSDWP